MADDKPNIRNPAGGPMLREMPIGTKLSLHDGSVVEIVLNPGNGGWLNVKYLEAGEHAPGVGEEEWIFFADVKDIVEEV